MMPEYVCPVAGITESELSRFADIRINGFLGYAQRVEALEDLGAYGRDEAEIMHYMISHLEQCGACRGVYYSELQVSNVLNVIKQGKRPVES